MCTPPRTVCAHACVCMYICTHVHMCMCAHVCVRVRAVGFRHEWEGQQLWKESGLVVAKPSQVEQFQVMTSQGVATGVGS